MIDRIRALLAMRQLTPTQFADLIQVGRPIISHILSGRNKASLDVVQRIIAAFPEVSLPWLLSGVGTMLAAPAIVSAEAAAPPIPPLSTALSQEKVSDEQVATRLTGKKAHSVARQSHSDAEGGNDRRAEAVSPASAQKAAFTSTDSRRPLQRFKVAAPLPVAADATTYKAQVQADAPAVPQSAPLPERISERDESPTASEAVPTLTAPANDLVIAAGGADKPIRRIVIFYRDGSFSDFQPES